MVSLSVPRSERAMAVAVLAAMLAAARAAPAQEAATSDVCPLLANDANKDFRRHTLYGEASCTCIADKQARCDPVVPYESVKPGSPDELLAQFLGSQVPKEEEIQLQMNQIWWTCYTFTLQKKRCKVTWPSNGSYRPACDCAAADGATSINRNYYVSSVTRRKQ